MNRFNEVFMLIDRYYVESPDREEVITGAINGMLIYYYHNGIKENEGEFDNGIQHGTYNAWHTNGKPKGQGFYRNGNKDSLWTYWDEKGNKKREEYYYTDGTIDLLNLWNHKDEQVIKDGKGNITKYCPCKVTYPIVFDRGNKVMK